MKKVLIIAHLSHASPRIPGLAKYLPEFGWQPIILTTPFYKEPNLQCRIIETGYIDVLGYWKRLFRLNPDEHIGRELRRRFSITYTNYFAEILFTLGGAIVDYPDLERGWKPFAVRAASEFLQNEDMDAMISSSSPVTSHIIANELKNKFKIPWIADLRDLWTQNHNYRNVPIRKLIDKRLELKTLLPADALVTVSLPWAEKLRTFHRREAVYTITNGFDPDKINIGQIDSISKFTITYTGNIYTEGQDSSKFFAALRDLISDGTIDSKEVEVRFYGPRIEWLDKEVYRYGLSSIVKQYGRVSQQIAIEKQRESKLLLLLNWEDQVEKGVYPLKIFEYLAAQRPILATGGFGSDVVEKLLDETKSGIYAQSVEDIKNVLRELYSEYKCRGKITYNGDIKKINKYSYRDMARKFAEVLDSLI